MWWLPQILIHIVMVYVHLFSSNNVGLDQLQIKFQIAYGTDCVFWGTGEVCFRGIDPIQAVYLVLLLVYRCNCVWRGRLSFLPAAAWRWQKLCFIKMFIELCRIWHKTVNSFSGANSPTQELSLSGGKCHPSCVHVSLRTAYGTRPRSCQYLCTLNFQTGTLTCRQHSINYLDLSLCLHSLTL